MTKIIVAGPRDCKNRDLIYTAIEQGIEELGIKPKTLVHGNATGVDTIAGEWGKENGLNIVSFPAEWDNLKVEGAVIKERWDKWKKKNIKYNAAAGSIRNRKMAEYVGPEGALIAINIDNSPGTSNMIKTAKELGLKVYVYEPRPMGNLEFGINFWE